MTTRVKCSGEKLGMGSKKNFFPLVSVSPISKTPGSNTPTTSPAQPSSTIVRSCARNVVGLARRISLPVRTCSTFTPRSNFPEQMRRNATLSRCARSMFAWILNTNAEKSPSGGMLPAVELCGPGGGIRSQNVSRKASSPKLFIALPKNIGLTSPARNFFSSNASPAASSSSLSSRRRP